MPDDVKTAVAEPSTAQTPDEKTFAAGKLSPEIKQRFMAKAQGKEPPQKQDTATADTQKETVTPENAAEPGAADNKQEKTRRKPSAEERIAELIADNKRLREENEEAKKTSKPAESSAAKPTEVKTEPAAKREAPKKPIKPKLDDFPIEKYETADKAYAAYEKAVEQWEVDRDKWTDEVREWDREETIRKFKAEAQLEAAQQKFNEYLKEAQKRYPNLKEVLPAFTEELAEVHPYVQQMLNSSEMLADVLMVIAGDAKAKAEFMKEAKANPAKAIRRIAITEKLVFDKLSGASKEGEKPQVAEKKEKAPAEKQTDELQPTHEVGNRGTGPGDPAAEAVRRANGKLTPEVKEQWRRKAAERVGAR